MAIEKGYLQSDDFAKKEYQDKVDFLSKHSPTFSKMDPTDQREFIFKRTKQPDYKPRDVISKIARFAVPLAGQYGGEALGGAAGLETGPGALATAMAGGGAGATLGEGAVDLMDFMRGMGPRPSLAGELRKAPMRMGYGAAGSGLAKGAMKLINPGTMEGPMETLFQHPRMYTRELGKGGLFEKGIGEEPAVMKAASKGSTIISKEASKAEQEFQKAQEEADRVYAETVSKAQAEYESKTAKAKRVADATNETQSKLHQEKLSEIDLQEQKLNKRIGEKLQAQREQKLQEAIDKTYNTERAIKEHWNKKGYGDPVERELQDPGPEPKLEQFKNIKEFKDAYLDWSKRANPPKKISLEPNALYNRYMQILRKRGTREVTKELPEEAELLQNFQSAKYDRDLKLSSRDKRRFGKAMNDLDDHIGELDPKYKELKKAHSQAMENVENIQRDITGIKNPPEARLLRPKTPEKVSPEKIEKPTIGEHQKLEPTEDQAVRIRLGKQFGDSPKSFRERYAQVARKGTSARSEQTFADLKKVESQSGTPFMEDMMKQMASEHFRRMTPEMRSMWLARTMFAAPFVLGGAAATGRIPPFWAGMIPFAAMMNPRFAAEAVTRLPKYGMQALSQAMRQRNEPERE